MNKKLIFSVALAGIFSQTYAQQEEKLIEEITIASKSTQKINKTGRNVTLITAQDLEKYKGQNISDILEQIAGFQITNNFSNSTEPKTLRVRGASSANVIILIDGVPLQDVSGAGSNLTDLRLLSLDNIESIEVLNGASSVLYGSNATASVIDIKTKKHSRKEIEAIAGVKFSSYNTFGQKLGVSGKSNVFHYQISANNEKYEGISSAKGDETFDKDGYEKQNIHAKLGVDLKNFSLNFIGGWNHNLYDYDNGAFSDGKYRGNDTQHYIGANANFHYSIGQIIFNTRYTESERIYETFNHNQYNQQNTYNGINSFTELYNELNIGKQINIVAGIQYEDQRLDYNHFIYGNRLNREDTKISHFDAFANARFNYKFILLDTGIRMIQHSGFGEHWVYSINPYLYQEFGNWFGKVGYTIGTAFISPTLYQSYGDGSFTLPNPNLTPETNESHEINLSLGKQNRTFVINASVFRTLQKDALEYRYDPTTFLGSYTNLEGNRTQGFEIGLNLKLNNFIKLGGNYSFIEKNNENEITMRRLPKHRANSYVEISAFKGNRMNFSHTFTSKRFDAYYDNTTFSTRDLTLSDFNLFNVNIQQQINKHLSAYFTLNNIFNKDYIDVVGYNTKNRNFIFGIDYKF